MRRAAATLWVAAAMQRPTQAARPTREAACPELAIARERIWKHAIEPVCRARRVAGHHAGGERDISARVLAVDHGGWRSWLPKCAAVLAMSTRSNRTVGGGPNARPGARLEAPLAAPTP